jgi:hypothetical protein
MAITQEVAHKVIANSLELARGIKEQVMEEADNPITGIHPMLVIGYGETIEDGGGIVELEMSNGSNPAEVLPAVLSDLQKDGHLEKWAWIGLIVEAFIDKRIGVDENYERGDAEKEYKENPFSTVKETMVVNIFTYDFQQFGAFQTFALDDFGKPVYQEVEFQDEGAGSEGLIPFVFRSFTEWCHIQEIKKQADSN